MKAPFEESEIMNVLHGFNPWWAGKPFQVPKFRRLAYEICKRHLEDPAIRRANLLSGPRRVGKTTILMQISDALLVEGRHPASVFYMSLDHPLLKLLALPDILRIYHEQIIAEGQPVVLLMDELQYSEDWEHHIKLLVDHSPQYRILATGSASVVQRRQLSESGVGRWLRTPIPTLSFYEFLRICNEDVAGLPEDVIPNALFDMNLGAAGGLAARFRRLLPKFARYLLVGGFPETALLSDTALCQRLLREDVVERVLKRDMTALFGVRNINDLEKLFIYICLHSGGILAVKTVAGALQTTPTTVSNHLDLLEQANLIYRLPPAGVGGKRVLKQRYKVYLVDAALRNAVLLRGEEIFGDPAQMGTIVETTVLRHLFAYYYRDSPRICYWRHAATSKEVDVIVQSPQYTLPVEVKYREGAELDEKGGLVAYCKAEQIKRAYLVTKRDDDFGVAKSSDGSLEVLRVPAHIFTYLLGQAERILWTK